MVLAIWTAVTVDNAHHYLSRWPALTVFFGLFALALLAMIARLLRRATLADLQPGPILGAWFLVRFAVIPATFLLALVWLIVWALRLEVAGTLGEAVLLTLLNGTGAILLTSALADLAAALRGPRRGSPSDS